MVASHLFFSGFAPRKPQLIEISMSNRHFLWATHHFLWLSHQIFMVNPPFFMVTQQCFMVNPQCFMVWQTRGKAPSTHCPLSPSKYRRPGSIRSAAQRLPRPGAFGRALVGIRQGEPGQSGFPHKNHGKTMGKPWENDGLMMVELDFMGFTRLVM